MNVKTASPVEIDTELASLYNKLVNAEAKVSRNYQAIARMGKESAENSYYALVNVQYMEKAQAEIVELDEEISDLMDQIAPLELEFIARGRWNRAYIVTNSNGHIHKSTNCGTCYPTTQFGWLTQVSGEEEAEIVSQAGEMACTVCYPSAPVDVLKKKSSLALPEVIAARAARAAVKSAKAEKAAKVGITNPDGTVLKDSMGWEVKTERQAQIRLTDELVYKILGWSNINEEAIERMLVALANKRGQELETVRAEMIKKAQIKAKK